MKQTPERHFGLPAMVILGLAVLGLLLILKAAFTVVSLILTLTLLAGVFLVLRYAWRKRGP